MNRADTYIPFMRQIMDWHRFCKNGYGITVDPYISIDITTKQTIDLNRLQQAVHQLLSRNVVLRTQFRMGHDALLYQIPVEADSPLFRIRHCKGTASNGYTEMVNENVALSIHESVLFKVGLIETGTVSSIRLYAHHLIAEPRSLGILKQELIACYRADKLRVKPATQQYVAYKNQRLFDRYATDDAFIRNVLSPIDQRIFRADPTQRAATVNESLHELCAGPYYHFGKKPGHSYYSALPIAGLQALMTFLRTHQTSLAVLLLVAFARVCQTIQYQKKLIGVLYNDGFSPQANQTIGHYMGESYIEVDRLLDTGNTLNALAPLQRHLFGLYKHAIFNYNFYNIDEAALYRHCIGFVNYSESADKLPRPTDARFFDPIDTVHFDLDPSFCCYQDAISVWWRFNKNTFSDQQIIAIDALFRNQLERLIQLVAAGKVPKEVTTPNHQPFTKLVE